MTQHILQGDPQISISLRRSARAKRISLRVSRLDGRVTLTLPNSVSEREALAFAQSKADWLRSNLQSRPTQVQIALGEELPFQGEMLRIAAGEGRVVEIRDDQILVPGPTDRVAAHLQAFLKNEARQRLVGAVDEYANALGRPYSKFTLRDTKSRWGSCTSAGGLMFSWRLVLAPEEVLRYVAAHEVAHLAQMNHSPRFWAVVEQLYGPYHEERAWLKAHGEKLHRYCF